MKEVNGNIYTSTIDHFACSRLLYDSIKEAGVIHCSENMSNHSAIYAKFTVSKLNHKIEAVNEGSKIMWSNASEVAKANYKETLKFYLDNIQLKGCISCQNFQCKIHNEEIDEYTTAVLKAIEYSSMQCLPSSAKNRSKKKNDVTPGWSELVRPYADESKFWQNTWC